jgi:hypothetical protein
MTRRILLTILVLLTTACLVSLAVTGIVGSFVTAQVHLKNAAPTVLPESIPTVASSGDVPADIAAQMDQIQQQVIILRGLEPKRPLVRALLTADQLRKKVLNDFFVDYTKDDAAKDAKVLNAFGLLPADFDLYQLYIELYSEQVAGYYDPKTKEMFVVQGKGFNGSERMTYSHEFTHVLQDQNYDLRDGLGFKDELCNKTPEKCAAIQSLIEGDATLSEQTWFFRYSTQEDRNQVTEMAKNYKSPVYDSAPQYLQKDFLFPYQAGLEFVQTLYDQNGWKAVDDAFTNPPESTSQILHPEKYPQEHPATIELPDLQPILGSNCQSLEENTFGEWYTSLVLSSGAQETWRQPEAAARAAATGWKGDHYRVFDCGEQPVLVLRSLWNGPKEAIQFFDTFEAYGSARWGEVSRSGGQRLIWKNDPGSYATLVRSGSETLWVLAQDMNQAQQILKSLPVFQEQ